MKYPKEKYRYYFHDLPDGGKEVIAISTYAGCTVKGKAICHPSDTYDVEVGKELAALRCGMKVAVRRVKRAENCCNKAFDEVGKAVSEYEKMRQYYTDATEELFEVQAELNDTLHKIMG